MAHELPATQYLVLALLAEKPAHGYELEQLVHNRGFRYWTDLQRSSIYGALKALEKNALIVSRLEAHGGPMRKVYRLNAAGRKALAREGLAYLSAPAHPRTELDLGIYGLPFYDKQLAAKAIDEAMVAHEATSAFLRERLAWCQDRGLGMPALAFERALITVEAELKWLARVKKTLAAGAHIDEKQWQKYVFKDPAAK